MNEAPNNAIRMPRWNGPTVIIPTLLILLVLLIGLFWTGYCSQEGSRLTQCRNNLKSLLLAFHNYHDSYGSFPPAYIADATGKPVHSWRVILRPYLESSDFYWEYRLDESWDSPHNRSLAEDYRAQAMDCPSADHPEGSLFANYVVVVGPGSAFPEGESTSLMEITDGPENTILVVEIVRSDILWSEPRDLRIEDMSFMINDPDRPSISSAHSGVVNVGLADGSVQRLDSSTDPEAVRALITIAGGEPLSKTTVDGRIHFRLRNSRTPP